MSRLPVQTSANTGSQIIATEAQVLTRYLLLLRQPAGSLCTSPVRHFNRAKRESDARSPFDLHQKTQLRQLLAGF
ncbi:hypothetical protein JYJ56_000846 [Salmonella enterica]|nr:hypothetical protein [Salmonella enterica]